MPRYAFAAIDSNEQRLRRSYAAFNARDIDAVLATTHPDVDWPDVPEGKRVQGHEALRAYWTAQFEAIDVNVEPVGFTRDDEGHVVVGVHQVVRDLDGKVLFDQNVEHVYTLRDGLVTRMDLREG